MVSPANRKSIVRSALGTIVNVVSFPTMGERRGKERKREREEEEEERERNRKKGRGRKEKCDREGSRENEEVPPCPFALTLLLSTPTHLRKIVQLLPFSLATLVIMVRIREGLRTKKRK